MGWDLNAHYEIKADGKWAYYGQGSFERNDELFCALQDIIHKDGQRYNPDDVTRTTRLHSDNFGEPTYSHTWLTPEEYVQWLDPFDVKQTSGENARTHGNITLFDSVFDWWLKHPRPSGVEDYRVIVWLA